MASPTATTRHPPAPALAQDGPEPAAAATLSVLRAAFAATPVAGPTIVIACRGNDEPPHGK